jgi:hypothetical protein
VNCLCIQNMCVQFGLQGHLTHGGSPRQQGRKRLSCILTLTALIGFSFRPLSIVMYEQLFSQRISPIVPYIRVFEP